MRVFYYIARTLLFLPFRILFPVKVIGKENLPKGRFVSVSNHLTGYDVILVWANVPRFKRFLAKNEFQKNPFSRFLFWVLGAIFIDRQKIDMKAMKKSIAVAKKQCLTIFPEGTRNRENDQLQQIKGGAAMIAVKADSVIVPIMIHHRTRVFKKNYIFIAPSIKLPYGSGDRFNNEAMQTCSQIIAAEMADAKDFLDNALKSHDKQELKRLNNEFKSRKKEYCKHIMEINKD